MMGNSARLVALAGAVLSLLAVILGALGSHLIDMRGLQSSWETALDLHMFTAVALLGLAALLAHRESLALKWGAVGIVAGVVVFSGSIYLHVITGFQLTVLTPVGGLLMMIGWLSVALSFVSRP